VGEGRRRLDLMGARKYFVSTLGGEQYRHALKFVQPILERFLIGRGFEKALPRASLIASITTNPASNCPAHRHRVREFIESGRIFCPRSIQYGSDAPCQRVILSSKTAGGKVTYPTWYHRRPSRLLYKTRNALCVSETEEHLGSIAVEDTVDACLAHSLVELKEDHVVRIPRRLLE
jgi:hypothetical protein